MKTIVRDDDDDDECIFSENKSCLKTDNKPYYTNEKT